MAQDKQDKKGTLINELDSLRHTLNSGPEFQQDIPTLNEQHSSPDREPSEQCDLFQDNNGIIHDPDLDVPILTDAYEEHKESLTPENANNVSNSESSNTEPTISELTASEISTPPEQLNTTDSTDTEESQSATQQGEPQVSVGNTSIDIEKLSDETDSSVMELEEVLDELVAEQLPKLEQQLREKLRSELEADIDTKIESEE